MQDLILIRTLDCYLINMYSSEFKGTAYKTIVLGYLCEINWDDEAQFYLLGIMSR